MVDLTDDQVRALLDHYDLPTDLTDEALIAEARREGWNAAIEAANWLGLTFYDKVPKGSLTSVTILEYREAIRALKETTHD